MQLAHGIEHLRALPVAEPVVGLASAACFHYQWVLGALDLVMQQFETRAALVQQREHVI